MKYTLKKIDATGKISAVLNVEGESEKPDTKPGKLALKNDEIAFVVDENDQILRATKQSNGRLYEVDPRALEKILKAVP